MKKSLFIMALGAIALTSCSQDEVIEVQKDAISFAAFNENASRADILKSADLVGKEFKVWGVVAEGATPTYISYIDGINCTVTGTRTNIQSGYYWPTGTMDFYAVYPADVDNASLGTPSAYASNTAGITGVEVADANNQTDILYALTTGQTKTLADVPLKFKHALSQVVFKVMIDDNVAQHIEVTLNSVTLKSLVKKGDFAFPKTAPTTGDGVGSWTLSNVEADKNMDYERAGINYVINNYTVAENKVSNETAPMLVIPQSKETKAAYTSSSWETDNNGLFVVNTTVAAKYDRDADGDYETSINLVNTPTYIPVTFTWEPGKKYVYTLVYTALGTGGKDENNNDQLLPIEFSVDVVDFTEVTEADINLGV